MSGPGTGLPGWEPWDDQDPDPDTAYLHHVIDPDDDETWLHDEAGTTTAPNLGALLAVTGVTAALFTWPLACLYLAGLTLATLLMVYKPPPRDDWEALARRHRTHPNRKPRP